MADMHQARLPVSGCSWPHGSTSGPDSVAAATGFARPANPARETPIEPPAPDVLDDPLIRFARPSLCPELELCRSIDFDATWARAEGRQGARCLPPPYWACTWPGGMALARHVLDNPGLVAGRRVLDLGTGSGLCALAAARGGAQHVLAADIDDRACRAVTVNARRNGLEVAVCCGDLLGGPGQGWDLILAADLWYERFLAQRVNGWLREQVAQGAEVLIGDVGRAFLLRQGLVELARHRIAAADGFEQQAAVDGVVYRLRSTRENTRRPAP
jgi:predicted nicotinamide N-methyase